MIGFTDNHLECRFAKIRSEGTNTTNFLADLTRIAAETDISLLNSGTMRIDSEIDKGPLRLKELFAMLPFIDPIVKLELTGEQLLLALENGVSQYPALEGRFPMVICSRGLVYIWPKLSGVSFAYDPSQSSFQRVVKHSVKVGGQLLDPAQLYTLATKQFLAEGKFEHESLLTGCVGKDGYDVLSKCKWLSECESSIILRSVIIEFFGEISICQKTLMNTIIEMVNFPEFREVWEQRHQDHHLHPKEHDPKILLKQSTGIKKKLMKYRQYSQLVADIKEQDNQQLIVICIEDDHRIKQL